ncbi:MAG: N-acetyltransferase [Spirochaetales bacterium]|nr:N-acetyltransferase [Spirochaetales bacterium]
MKTVTFEKINRTHYKPITEIYNYFIRHSTATYHIRELSEQDVIAHFEISSASTEGFIIRNNKHLAGFCLIRQYNKKQGYKYTYEITIYLKPGHAKQGIGTKTIAFLEQIAREKKVHVLIAGICTENSASISLFEKSGYKKCGYFQEMGYKFNRFLDNVYFQKILDAE